VCPGSKVHLAIAEPLWKLIPRFIAYDARRTNIPEKYCRLP
jgi:hypothetical protein